MEMLYTTSLVAVVGIGDQPWLSPRRLKIINTKVGVVKKKRHIRERGAC